MRLLSWLPPAWMQALAGPVGNRFAAARRRPVARRNLEACYPQLSEHGRSALIESNMREYGRTLTEMPWVWCRPLDRVLGAITEVHGLERVRRAQAQNRGLIFAAPHFGAWELLGLYLQSISDMAILFKSPKDPGLEPLLIRKRSRVGAKVLPADSGGIRQVLRHLRRGGGVGILPDQQPKDGEGLFAPFFGVPALTMTLLPKLARKTGAEVLFTVCERLPEPMRYRVHFLAADPNILSADEAVALKAMNRGVEQCIAIDPAQYLWSYKRFKIQPPDRPGFYAD